MAKIEIVQDTILRPCYVSDSKGNSKGLFHCWTEYKQIHTAIFKGEISGIISSLYGVVEFEDGTVKLVEPYKIIFADNKISDYCFEKKGVVKW